MIDTTNDDDLLSLGKAQDLAVLKKELQLLKLQNSELVSKVEELKCGMEITCSIGLEKIKKELSDAQEERLSKLEDQLKDSFKSLDNYLKIIPGPSKSTSTVTHKIINTSRRDKDPKEGDMPNVELVNIGHNVMADNDIWSNINSSTTKDDWAYAALLAVFGENAKYYRVRKPRTEDADQRQFPIKPPVLFVLENHYKQWLKAHPDVMDEKPPQNKKDTIDDKEWEKLLEAEKEEERDARRRDTLKAMVKRLGGLLGDKATNMYRQPKGRSRQGSSHDSSDESLQEDSDVASSSSNSS